jgi:4-amino-4-deoxy-L-arabinose transferase-like glycosyltransferase
MEESKPTNPLLDRTAWVILLIALMFTTFVRCRLADFPLERDEGEYAYAGQLILEGVPPYSLAYNMKLPGAYLAYAGLMAIFGQTTVGIHWGLLVVNLASIVLIFLMMRDLFDSITGALAAVCFAVLSPSSTILGFAAHATHFVALFGIAGTWVLWRAIRSDNILMSLAAGLLLGIAFLMKQQGVFLPCFGGAAILLSCIHRRSFFSLRHLSTCLVYAVGAVLPFAAVCLWLWLAGTFDKFWFWTIEYARTYATRIPLSLGCRVFLNSMQGIISTTWPIWLLALVGAGNLAFMKGVPERRAFVFAFVAASFLCVCPGFYFRGHYFVVFLPSVAMLAGIGFIATVRMTLRMMHQSDTQPSKEPAPTAMRRQSRQKAALQSADNPDVVGRWVWMGLVTLLLAAAVVFPVFLERDYYFSRSPEKLCRRLYAGNPFWESIEIADYLQKHTKPDDRIAIIGSEPQIYFYAKRKSATGYIYTYSLMEPQPFARKMQDEMIREIESAKPEYLVFVNISTSWLPQEKSEKHIIDWCSQYTHTAYRTVGLVDILSSEQTDFRWDADAIGAKPQSPYHVWIFKKI